MLDLVIRGFGVLGPDAVVAVVPGAYKHPPLLEKNSSLVKRKVGGLAGHHCVREHRVLEGRRVFGVV